MKNSILSKVAMQVSDYFKKAFEFSQSNTGIKAFDNGRFANILMYHSYYFEALAYYMLGQDNIKTANDNAKGMGKACAYVRCAMSVMEKARKVVGSIPNNYQENFNTKYSEFQKVLAKAADENKTIYFEKEPAESTIPTPDMQNFVKFDQPPEAND